MVEQTSRPAEPAVALLGDHEGGGGWLLFLSPPLGLSLPHIFAGPEGEGPTSHFLEGPLHTLTLKGVLAGLLQICIHWPSGCLFGTWGTDQGGCSGDLSISF